MSRLNPAIADAQSSWLLLPFCRASVADILAFARLDFSKLRLGHSWLLDAPLTHTAPPYP